jgi:hypothetical protein
MYKEELMKEQRILSQMHKTLSNIVKEVTPPAGNPTPLSNGTIEEIKYCFSVISGREKELADKLGIDAVKPQHEEAEAPASSGLRFVKLPKRPTQSL